MATRCFEIRSSMKSRGHRVAVVKEQGNDLKALIAALKRKESADERRLVSLVASPEPKKHAKRKAG